MCRRREGTDSTMARDRQNWRRRAGASRRRSLPSHWKEPKPRRPQGAIHPMGMSLEASCSGAFPRLLAHPKPIPHTSAYCSARVSHWNGATTKTQSPPHQARPTTTAIPDGAHQLTTWTLMARDRRWTQACLDSLQRCGARSELDSRERSLAARAEVSSFRYCWDSREPRAPH